jgi:DNA/RNA-binding domain of Phe-tRNA-synthetase-like protein
MARGTRRPWIEEAYRGISRRDPFPVVNLAVDAARLLALHFAVPVSAIDRAKVSAPLFLRIAPPGMRIKSLGAEIDAGGLPVLTDASGVAGSPFFDVARAMPGTQTTEILLVACEPEGASTPLDAADLAGRAANWLGTLTGARPAE